MNGKNPMFSNIETGEAVYDNVDQASYKGISLKTVFLLAITIIIASVVAFLLPQIIENNLATFGTTLIISTIVGFIAVIVGRRSERYAKYCGVIYAICEGLFLGCFSNIAELYVPGVVTIALFSTLAVFLVVLLLFATKVIRVNNKFRSIAFALTLGALALILLNGIFYMTLGDVYGTYSTIILVVEAFLLIYGAITLSLNFAEASSVVERGASKNAEWSVSLGLMVSLVYIYVQIVRLILIIASKNRN